LSTDSKTTTLPLRNFALILINSINSISSLVPLSLAKHGCVIFQGAYGHASIAYDHENTFDTAFNLASVGKMFTGIAVAQRQNRVCDHAAADFGAATQHLLTFANALLGHRLRNAADTDLVLAGKVKTTPPFPSGVKYAYGFEDFTYRGTRIVGHGGSAPGAATRVDIFLG
jgi:hypothetical protein